MLRSRMFRMMVDLMSCKSIIKSATDRPKNLCGILTGVREMNGMKWLEEKERKTRTMDTYMDTKAVS